jgi:RNAse (barnase) inhibitor barstar
MKRFRFLPLTLMFGSVLAVAQTAEVHSTPLTDNDIKLLRQDLQSTRENVIKHTMEFTPAENAAFWPVYQEYSREQNAIASKRLQLIHDYAANLDKMDDATAKNITERELQIEEESLNLRKKYLPKFSAAIGAKRAAKFFQVDNRLAMMIDVQLASEIPLIP